MKLRSTSLRLVVLSVLIPFIGSAQSAGDFRSAASGPWATVATWETFDGATWNPAVAAPTSADGVITIRNTHNVTIGAAVTADQIVVDAGGTLTNNVIGFNLTLNDGAGTDLQVDGHYVLGGTNTVAAAAGTPTIVINNTMAWSNGTLDVNTTISATGVLTTSGNQGRNVNDVLTNNGIINWVGGVGGGGFGFLNGTFTNNNIINEQFVEDRGFINNGGTNSFVNNGTFNKTTTFTFFNNTVPFTNTGTIQGTGGINLTGTVTNTGTYRPGGNNAGTLNIASATGYAGTAVNAFLQVISNTGGPGVGNDLIAFGASVNLNGTTLTISDATFAPPVDPAIFTVMTTTGTFTGTPTLNLPPNYTYIGIVGGNQIQVQKNTVFALPVTWGTFTALADRNQVKLNWSTVSEERTLNFVVEYSNNGGPYVPLATIPAAGSSSSVRHYSYVHTAPNLSNNNLYRIRQVDQNHNYDYSAIRSVRFAKGLVVPVQASPNPVRDILNITVQTSDISIKITDLSGRLIKDLPQLQPGVHQVDMKNLPSGVYQLSIFSKKERIDAQRIMKQ